MEEQVIEHGIGFIVGISENRIRNIMKLGRVPNVVETSNLILQ